MKNIISNSINAVKNSASTISDSVTKYSRKIQSTVSDIIHEQIWPEWLSDDVIDEIGQMHVNAAQVLWFSRGEIEIIKQLNFAELFAVCQNNEWPEPEWENPANKNTKWVFSNYFFKKFPENQHSWVKMQDYINALYWNSKDIKINLYPNRAETKEDFLSTVYHEIVHHLTEIKLCQVALKNNFTDALSWRRHLESNDELAGNYIILQEAIAHLEWWHFFIKNWVNNSRNRDEYIYNFHKGSEVSGAPYLWIQLSSQSILETAYAQWSQMGNMLYQSQISIYNYLQSMNRSSFDEKFYAWNRNIRDYLTELIMDPDLTQEFFKFVKENYQNPQAMLSIWIVVL